MASALLGLISACTLFTVNTLLCAALLTFVKVRSGPSTLRSFMSQRFNFGVSIFLFTPGLCWEWGWDGSDLHCKRTPSDRQSVLSSKTDVEGSYHKAGLVRWANGPQWVHSAFLTNIGSAALAQFGSAQLPQSRNCGSRGKGRRGKKRWMTVFLASAQGVKLFRWLLLRAWPALLSALSSPSSSRVEPPLTGWQRGSAGESMEGNG